MSQLPAKVVFASPPARKRPVEPKLTSIHFQVHLNMLANTPLHKNRLLPN
jgi:hypothetical protein